MIFLVVGSCGFIGTEFTQYARSKGHTVKGCDILSWEEKAKELFPVKSDYWCTSKNLKIHSLRMSTA